MSFREGATSSGDAAGREVVPSTVAVWLGTVMSPSEGGRRRLTTWPQSLPSTTSMLPWSSPMATSQPAMAATCGAQAPAALMTISGTMVRISPLRLSKALTRTTIPPSNTMSVTRQWLRTMAPASRALSTFAWTSAKGSMDPS